MNTENQNAVNSENENTIGTIGYEKEAQKDAAETEEFKEGTAENSDGKPLTEEQINENEFIKDCEDFLAKISEKYFSETTNKNDKSFVISAQLYDRPVTKESIMAAGEKGLSVGGKHVGFVSGNHTTLSDNFKRLAANDENTFRAMRGGITELITESLPPSLQGLADLLKH